MPHLQFVNIFINFVKDLINPDAALEPFVAFTLQFVNI